MVVPQVPRADFSIAVLNAGQRQVHQIGRGVGVEGKCQRAAAVDITAYRQTANLQHTASIKIQTRRDCAAGTKDVITAGTANTRNGQRAAAPVAGTNTLVQRLQIKITQYSGGVDHYR